MVHGSNGAGKWKSFPMEDRDTCLYYIVKTMAADYRVTKGAGASAAMVLIQFCQNIPAPVGTWRIL